MMKALKLTDQGDDTIEIKDVEVPSPAAGQVLVELKAASLNHRDQWCREGKYPGLTVGTTLGSDGAGVVTAVGDSVAKDWVGEAVVINPNINWGDDPRVQCKDYHILGMPTDGTFANYVVVNADRLVKKPASISFEDAASLPIGAMTAFRAVFTKAQVQAGDTVLVTGIGGGVSQFAALMLKAKGVRYFVTSGSAEKLEAAISNGAAGGFNYREDKWWKGALKETEGFDAVIDSAGGDLVNTYLKLIKPGGKIVMYGSTAGMPSSLDAFRLFWSQASIEGSTMANDEEFAAMVQFVADHQLKPVIDSVRPFAEIVSAFDKMKAGEQNGKLVVVF